MRFLFQFLSYSFLCKTYLFNLYFLSSCYYGSYCTLLMYNSAGQERVRSWHLFRIRLLENAIKYIFIGFIFERASLRQQIYFYSYSIYCYSFQHVLSLGPWWWGAHFWWENGADDQYPAPKALSLCVEVYCYLLQAIQTDSIPLYFRFSSFLKAFPCVTCGHPWKERSSWSRSWCPFLGFMCCIPQTQAVLLVTFGRCY